MKNKKYQCHMCKWHPVCLDPLRGLKDYAAICDGYLDRVQYIRSKAYQQRMADEARETLERGEKDGNS